MKNLLFLFLLVTAGLSAQDNINERILRAYITNDAEVWDTVLAELSTTVASPAEHLLLGHAAYSATGAAFAEQDSEMALRYLDQAQTSLETVLASDDRHAAAHGLMSGIMGMRIAFDQSQAMRLGQAANRHAGKAIRFGEDDAVALMMGASQLIYTPRQWGGDPERGLELVNRAVALFEAAEGAEKNWRYYEALVLQAQALVETDQKEAARAVYLKTLGLQPDFAYVKFYLLPQLDAE